MGIKRLFKKGFLGGGGLLIEGHIFDALQKKKETGKSFRECLSQSVKETFTEDLPGTSHIYHMGHRDGKIEGVVEQATRDEKMLQDMHKRHEDEREEWRSIDKEKDELLSEIENQLK